MLAEDMAKSIREEPRFQGMKPLKSRKTTLLFPDIYKEEITNINKAMQSETVGESVNALEEEIARFIGVEHAAALSSGTAAMHMAVRLAAKKVYGSTDDSGTLNSFGNGGMLNGRFVFCPDLTSSAIVNPVIYEGGEPVFIDASSEDWGMDPEALEIAFGKYPDVKIVIMTHLYGFPGQIQKVKKICEKNGALLIEDACESLGAEIEGKQTGSFGDYGVLSFHNDDIFPETDGGMLLTGDLYEVEEVRKMLSRSPSKSLEFQHNGLGYSYEMGDVSAEMIRSRMYHLNEYIAKKKAIYGRYRKSFPEDLMLLNPVGEKTEPNYRTSCMTVESSIGFMETRSEREYEYVSQHGTAAPMEILDALAAFGAKGKPVWKPMHMQPFYKKYDQITLDGSKRDYESSPHNDFLGRSNESADIFRKGLCLPSDIWLTEEEQERVIEIIFSCYNKRDLVGNIGV